MSMKTSKTSLRIVSGVFIYVFCVMAASAGAQSMDELHKAAIKEGGVVNFYGTLAHSGNQGQSRRCHGGQACCQGDH